ATASESEALAAIAFVLSLMTDEVHSHRN
ncbi:unnamed protein product, partial [Onchocerca ochengi]